MVGGGAKKEKTGPRKLESWEVELTGWLMDWYRSIKEDMPFEETQRKFVEGIDGLIANMGNIAPGLQAIANEYIPKLQSLDQTYVDATSQLKGLADEISKTPATYDARFKNISRMYQQEAATWGKYREEAGKEYSEIKAQMPMVNIGGMSLRHQPKAARAAYDAQMSEAGTQRSNAIGNLGNIQKGYMDTLNNSLNQRTNIAGTLLPGLADQRANLQAGMFNMATKPLETEANMAPTIANLMQARYQAGLAPLDYITKVMLARSGISTGKSSGWDFNIANPFAPIQMG